MIKLKSHAIPASPLNTPSITYNGGKPETVVTGECAGIVERLPGEPVHLRDGAGDSTCIKCGRYAITWYDREDKWADHSAKCC